MSIPRKLHPNREMETLFAIMAIATSVPILPIFYLPPLLDLDRQTKLTFCLPCLHKQFKMSINRQNTAWKERELKNTTTTKEKVSQELWTPGYDLCTARYIHEIQWKKPTGKFCSNILFFYHFLGAQKCLHPQWNLCNGIFYFEIFSSCNEYGIWLLSTEVIFL